MKASQAFSLLVSLSLISISAATNTYRLPSDLIRPVSNWMSSNTACKSVWENDGGSRCDVALMNKFFSNTKNIAENMASQLQRELDTAKEKLNDSNLLTNTDTNSLNFYRKLDSKEVRDGFADSFTKCINKQIKSFGASLCYICSANYQNYLVNGKIIISEAGCGEIINECKPYFDRFASILGGVHDLYRAVDQNIGNWDQGRVGQMREVLSKFEEKFEKSEILKYLKEYSDDSNQNKKKDSANKICTRMLSFHNVGENALSITISVLDFTTKWAGSMAKFKEANSKSRLLQMSTRRQFGGEVDDNENPFEGDIAIYRQSDNMFESYDGSKGTTLDYQYSNQKPMNLETSLP